MTAGRFLPFNFTSHMNHAAMATALYRASAAIEAFADWMPGCVAEVLKPHAASLNRIADWHWHQASIN
jgi:hypothetical protein